jgi:hypothetical protein
MLVSLGGSGGGVVVLGLFLPVHRHGDPGVHLLPGAGLEYRRSSWFGSWVWDRLSVFEWDFSSVFESR